MMDYQTYVVVTGTFLERHMAMQDGFPVAPTFKELRSYMLDANITGTLANQLEQLLDEWRQHEQVGSACGTGEPAQLG